MKDNPTLLVESKKNNITDKLFDFIPSALLIIILIFFILYIPNFFRVQTFINLTKQIAINGIIATGMTLTILSGGLDLSVGSILVLAIAVGSFAIEAGLTGRR